MRWTVSLEVPRLSFDCRRPVPDFALEWCPQSFKYPAITPWTDFDFEKTLPPPHRPFRWGPTYNVTMGIRSMDFTDWIQVG